MANLQPIRWLSDASRLRQFCLIVALLIAIAAEGKDVPIDARPRWNRTGVRVVAGQTYRFTARGVWCDAGHCCGPGGYEKRALALFKPLRRVRHAPWFALIGTIEGKDPFVIGNEKNWTAPREGELWCYANDVRFMYWNNKGSVVLTIDRGDSQNAASMKKGRYAPDRLKRSLLVRVPVSSTPRLTR